MIRDGGIRPAYRRGVSLLVAAVTASACGAAGDAVDERTRRAARATGDLVIGAAWPWEAASEFLYREGLDLAMEEVNAGGGINGRPLRFEVMDDRQSVTEGRMVAQRLGQDPDVVAVVGHLQSYVSVPAAAIYDLAGVVMFAPFSTDPELTRRQYSRVFRGTFTDPETGRQLARFASDEGLRRVVVYYVRSEYGRGLANAFEEHAAGAGIAIVARQSYEPAGDLNVAEIERVVREWEQLQFDAVFLADEVPHAAHLISAVRRHGHDVPILAADAVAAPSLIEIAGPAAEGTIVATAFHADNPRPEVQRFVHAFEARFGTSPDMAAALGYDAIGVLVHAMRTAGTAVPDRVADALRATRDWRGVTGSFSFTDEGDLTDKPIVQAVVRGGRFEFLDELFRTDPGEQR
jgi:branched-chain amino acid transport system substrate-binding protein